MTAPCDRSGEAGETAKQARSEGRERGDAEGGRRPNSTSGTNIQDLQKALDGLTMVRDLIREARDVTTESFVTDYLDDAEKWLDKVDAILSARPPSGEAEVMARALEPFARVAWLFKRDDEMTVVCRILADSEHKAELSSADFQRAAEALTPKSSPQAESGG